MGLAESRHLGDLFLDAAGIFRPPERLTVTEAAKKYRYLKNRPKYEGYYKPDETPYMVEPQNMTMSPDFQSVIFCGPSQSGKALPLDTPIATPGGWTTMGELSVGDLVFDNTGRPTKVVFATETMVGHKCYRVSFDDGSSVIADADHVWTVDRTKSEQGYGGPASVNITTEDMRKDLTFGKKPRYSYAIKNSLPLHLREKKLPMAPYTLGAWLGDGHSLGGRLYGTPEDLKTIAKNVRRDGYKTNVRVDGKGLGVLTVVTGQKVRQGPRSFLTNFNDRLRQAGAFGKRIPAAYLRASFEQRAALLRGLMDTDGTIGKGGVSEFSNCNKDLVDGFCELAVSLGLKVAVRQRRTACTYKGRRVQGSVSWRVTFVAYSDFPVFTLKRKLERQRERSEGRPGHTERRRVVDVSPAKSVPVRCIQVAAKSHMYLAGRQMVPTHNTEALILNSLAYVVKCNPMDYAVFCATAVAARDFAKRRVDRMHRHSEKLKEELLPGSQADTTHDKTYRSGIIATISWPSVNEMSSKPIPFVALTEYDRMPEDIDGEGSAFILAKARTTYYGNLGMTVVDSSPSKPIVDPKAVVRGHEAPPCDGVLGLYNEGDRRRWYWPCPHCGEFFEGKFSLLVYSKTKKVDGEDVKLTPYECSRTVYMACPKNGCVIEETDKVEMNSRGVWLREGEKVRPDGTKYGDPLLSDSASFWLRGTAAAYKTWKTLVLNYEKAVEKYEKTGTEEDLKTTVNTDQAEPYAEKTQDSGRLAEDLMSDAVPGCNKMVPIDVRALFACIDVQDNRFEVQVMGVRPGASAGTYDVVVIDRFAIKKSKRLDEHEERFLVRPSAYKEDWDLIEEEVMSKVYPLTGGIGEMSIALTLCDSGGRAGATTNAYNFWRKLRAENKHNRFLLVKGASNAAAPRVELSFPDTKRKDRHANARGEIPLLFINTNLMKDTLNGWLDRDQPGGGRIEFSDHFDMKFFEELCVEVRNAKGQWENTAKRRNEAWDLLVYFLSGLLYKKVDKVDWEDPPSWLDVWEDNALVRIFQAEKGRVDKREGPAQSIAALAAELA